MTVWSITYEEISEDLGLSSGLVDSTAPTVAITTPTSSSTYTTSSSTVTLGGTAADNVRVKEVTWYNAAMGSSGTASGTTSWTASGITLNSGSNLITVTAKDFAGNTSTDTLTVTYTGTTTSCTGVTLTVNGSTVTGNIESAGAVDWYQFTVSTAGTYTIETWAGTLTDNYMYLYGPNSCTTYLEEDDDDGVDLAAKITRYLSVTGTYYVKVKAYSSTSTGTYTIKVTQ